MGKASRDNRTQKQIHHIGTLTMLYDQSTRCKPVQLRPYQVEAVEEVQRRINSGIRRLLIVAATGSGKTTIAAHIILNTVENGSRVLFMAHRRELIVQAYNRLIDLGIPEEHIGIHMGRDKRSRPSAPVQVASVDTLRNRTKPLADIVFTDEAHRAKSVSYKNIAGCYPHAIHLGLTATPFRANGAGLGDVYDDLLVVASPLKLIAEGYLVEPRVFTVPTESLPDLSCVKIKQGDYDQRALAEVVDKKALVGNLVEHWIKHARGIRTVAFAVSVAHSKHIVEQFQQAGVAAEHLDGTTPIEERDAILQRLEIGETTLVANCSVLAEGYDQPAVKCAILARPTKSTGLYLQQAGRILRPYNGQRAIILDHGGCVLQHGLPQQDRLFSLEGTKKRKGDGQAPVIVCPQCFVVLPLSTRVCPECGQVLFELEKQGIPKEREGDLVEVFLQDKKSKELNRLRNIAAARGYKPGWVYYRYKEKFGEAPPSNYQNPNPWRIDEQVLKKLLQQAAHTGGILEWNTVDRAIEQMGRAS